MPDKRKNRRGQNILFIFSALFLKNKNYSTNSYPLTRIIASIVIAAKGDSINNDSGER